MKIKLISSCFLFIFFSLSVISAKLSMPSIFGDNMVLQRNTNVAIYGTADPDQRITVRVT